MSRVTKRKAATVLAAVFLAVVIAACGSSSSSSSSGSSSTTSTENGGSATTAETTTAAAGGIATAEKMIAPYIGHPSAFPVTEKLNEIPKGANLIYMDCGTPVCALIWEFMQAPAATMGVHLERIKAGLTANTVSAAFETAISKKPDAVLVGAIDINLWAKQLEELQAANIAVVVLGVVGTKPYGVVGAEIEAAQNGELMASYVAAKMNPEANVVIYEVPELSFSGIVTEKFVETMATVCPKCSVRTSHIAGTEIGSTAPNTVVSDLQANPETDVAVFTSDEIEAGLPTALKAAGIEVETLGYGPSPTNLQYIKEGKETAALAADGPVSIWTVIDAAARGIIGQELAGPESEGIVDEQFLTQKDITFDPSKGWTGYPDFAERFKKLWGIGG
jgi:ribose transport system substrate-binding protein